MTKTENKLRRYVKKMKAGSSNSDEIFRKPGRQMMFSTELENAFSSYIEFRAKICYGMSVPEVREGAYKLALSNNVDVPASWHVRKMAGTEWFLQFRIRHPELSLRKSEPCSLSRATAFNRTNVNKFFDNLEAVFRDNPTVAEATRIFNLDETALMTVQASQKVLAGKGTRRLSQAVRAERGTLITTCCIICASGMSLPPVLIFPRKNFKPFMKQNAPVGTLGLAQPTRWMTGDIFLEVMKHFVRHTHSSKENRSLLIYDNHESHLSFEVINYAKDNGVIILTIPPHCSGRLQLCDVGVYKSLKTYYNSTMDSWMLMHTGQTI